MYAQSCGLVMYGFVYFCDPMCLIKTIDVLLFAGCSIGALSGQPDSHATVIGGETEHCSSNSVVLFDLAV